jgi:hypothetical protein
MGSARPLLLLFLLIASFAGAKAASASSSSATVSFTFDFPQSSPQHYVVVVDSSGKATYTSGLANVQSSNDDSEQPYRYEFTISPATRERIFDLAARAHYFSENVNYDKHNIANTGAKTLAYKDGQRSTEAKYNYTTNPAVQQLTTLFQNISNTLEFGRRLDYAYRYQKLALDEQLKKMEEAAKQNGLSEGQAIAPILKQIAGDRSVMNVTRARAERLLGEAGGSH